jgi:hypothetical protein
MSLDLNIKSSGWNWGAFFLGPIWYFSKGLNKKAFCLLVICIVSFLFASPFIMFYSGFSANRDLFNRYFKEKSSLDLNTIKF